MGCSSSRDAGVVGGGGGLDRSDTLTLASSKGLLEPLEEKVGDPLPRTASQETLTLVSEDKAATGFRDTSEPLIFKVLKYVATVGVEFHFLSASITAAADTLPTTDAEEDKEKVAAAQNESESEKKKKNPNNNNMPEQQKVIGFQVWDVASSKEHGYQEGSAKTCPFASELVDLVIVVADVTDATTLEDAAWWAKDAREKAIFANNGDGNELLPVVLFLTKTDAERDPAFPDAASLDTFCAKHALYTEHVVTSAATKAGIDTALQTLAKVAMM
eukprot:UC1_evm1s1252